MNFWIVESRVYPNTWFLFRNEGKEIRIKSYYTVYPDGRRYPKFHVSHELKKEEVEYFRKHVYKAKTRKLSYELQPDNSEK